jgi:hypothetical protein
VPQTTLLEAGVANAQAPLVYISVTPKVTSIQTGNALSYTATGIYSDRATQDLTNAVVWSSSNPNSATIATSGTATGVTGYTSTQINATASGITGTANLAVWPTLGPSCTPGGAAPSGVVPNTNIVYFFQSSLVPVTMTLTNPYSGATLSLNGTYNANTSTYQGAGTFNTLLMTNATDLMPLDQGGVQTVCNMNRIILGNGDDVLDLTSTRFRAADTLISGGGGEDFELWYAENALAAPNARPTLTIRSNVSASIRAVIAEYHGVVTTGSLDQHATAIGTSNLPLVTTGTTSQATELLVGYGEVENSTSFTPRSGYSNDRVVPSGSGAKLALEHTVSATAGAQTAGYTVSAQNLGMGVATFRVSPLGAQSFESPSTAPPVREMFFTM